MITSIEDYLSQLKRELSGCDRATIQDALADAEEYLRTALKSAAAGAAAPESALSEIIEKYGSPEEVAAAYREIEYRIMPTLASPGPGEREEPDKGREKRSFVGHFFGVFADPKAWGAFLYLLFSLATGILYFTWVVTGMSLSAGLLILIIGLPFAGLFILSVRGIGLVEGRIVEALLGVRMPRRPQFHRRGMGWWSRFKGVVLDGHTWLSIVYMVLQLPLGIIYFNVLVTLMAASLYGIALPILQLGFDLPVYVNNGFSYYLAGWMFPFVVVGGILLATLTMHLAKYTGRMHGALAKALLVRS
jgi:hypothetical protein